MGLNLARLLPPLAAVLLLAGAARAQELPQQPDPPRAVKMFNIFCLSQLPDLAGVAKAAGFGEFAPIAGKELDSYRPMGPVEDFHAWRFHDQGAEYVLTATRSQPDDGLEKQLPKLAQATKRSTEVACSLLFPAAEAKAPVLASLSKMLGRAPDETREEGLARLYVWNGKGDKTLSRVDYSLPLQPGPKGVLSASLFVLN
jgi:hypothetical protein